MRKYLLYIGLEFVFGPVLKHFPDENGNVVTGIDVVDHDEIIKKMDKEINELWCSLYSKDENSVDGLKFDSVREKELAPTLLKMINELKNRINSLNDGTFEIYDMITEYLESLID